MESYFNICYNTRNEPEEGFNLNHPDFFPNFEWGDGYCLTDPFTKEKVKLGENERWEAFLEVDMEYSAELHEHHDCYPLAPENVKINGSKEYQERKSKNFTMLH